MSQLADKGNPASKGAGGDQARALQRVPPYGVIVEQSWAASAATETLTHGMGHVFTGAIVIKQSDSGVAYRISDEETSRALDLDIDNEIGISPSAPHTGTAWVWIF